MNKTKIREFFVRWHEDNPEPQGELDYVNDFTLLVAVVLSAQATDVGVNKATKELFKQCTTPEDILELGLDGLIRHIKTIGLFNSKAKNVIALCRMMVDDYDSKVPETRDELERLPGVGRKTANVVLNIAFGQPTIAVDTHLFRVGNRTGIAKGKTPLAVEKKMEKVIPKEFVRDSHHWLILHGRYICKARKPLCEKCIVSDLCEFKGKIL